MKIKPRDLMNRDNLRLALCTLLAFALTLAMAGCASKKTPAASEISAVRDEAGLHLEDMLKSHVMYLASDSLEGRLPGTLGIEKAAEFIAGELEKIGLEPAFEGSYYQEFEIELGMQVVSGPFVQFGEGGIPLEEEVQALPFTGSGGARGEVIFAPSDKRDYAGCIIVADVEPEIQSERWTMIGRDAVLERMRELSAEAEEQGAAGILFVSGGARKDTAADLRDFPVGRTTRQVGIPAIEATHRVVREVWHSPLGRPGAVDVCSLSVAVKPRSIEVRNVGALIRGATAPEEYLVVGAHYDHLGYGDISSSTPWRREVHNGADDNASGVASLIEIARAITAAGPPERSIVFVCFTAEELGALGSGYFCEHPPFPIDSAVAMINLDTVGRLDDGNLIIFGALSAVEISGVIGEIKTGHQLRPVEKKEIYGFSDQNPFYERGIPSLHFFTGAYDDYHSPDDDWQKLNYDGLAAVTGFVTDFTLAIDSIESLTPNVTAEEESPPVTSRGKGAFLGIVPDFAYGGTGVGLKGTVPKSPAEAAGLQDGDVIVAIDDRPIADLRALMVFLSGKGPGDEIRVKVMRGSSPIVKTAILSVRSSQ
jgi:hypothetical protein